MANGNEGRLLAAHLVKQIRKLRLERFSIQHIADLTGTCKATVEKYTHDIAEQFRRERDRPEPGAYDDHPHDYSNGVRER